MFPAGPVVDEIEAALRLHDQDDIDDIWHSINLAYYELCNERPFQALRKKVSLDFSDKDSENRMVLPADLINVYDVWDADGDIQYFEAPWGRTERDDLDQDMRYRWFYAEAVVDPLLTTDTIAIEKDATTFTMTPAWSATYLNEYIRFEATPGFFKLTGDKTISPAYNGEGLSSSYGEIRPQGTRRISIRDRDGAALSNTIHVYYWAMPRALCNDHDMILLPDTRALELMTMIRVLGEKDKKSAAITRWEAQLREAKSRLFALDPVQRTQRRPMNRLGHEVTFGKWIR